MQCLELDEINWLQLLEWDVTHAQELRMLGYGFVREGRYERAEACFEALVLLCPNEAYDWQMLGAILLENEKLDQSLISLNRALALNPSHLPTLLNKARVLLVLGQVEEGLALACSLEQSENPEIAGPAGALVLGYGHHVPGSLVI